MPLSAQIDQDLTTSMKEGQAVRTGTLRLIKNALKNEQIKLGHELTEAEVLKVLQREAKQRRDSITQYQAGNRADLADAEQQELAIIEAYLPDQMGETELAKLVETVISELGATGPAQMGAVIGAVMQRAGGRADGGAVATQVRQKLTS
jgi:uncharacterized protein YqeY